jgi:hypothetical protein
MSLTTVLLHFRGIVTAVIRFVSFFRIDLESDPTWYAPNLFSYTVVEPSAYLMCSCFPSLRPLLRVVYKWTRTQVNSQYGSGTGRTGQSEITLRHIKGSHRTSISATKMLSRDEDDKSNFIRLDESVDVDVSPSYRGGSV